MKKIISIVYISVFILTLLLPFLFINDTKNCLSQIDNRKLANFPRWDSVNFGEALEQYFKDRIGGRRLFIKCYQIFNYNLLNDLGHPLYQLGKDGHVFRHVSNITFYDYHIAFADAVLKMQNYCEERNVRFYLIFDPEKNSVYRQYLADGINFDNSWTDSLFSYFDKLGIHYVNNTNLLLNLSKQQHIFNTKYDAGHWNDLGAFYGTNALYDLVNKDFPNVKPLEKSDFDISQTIVNHLPVSDFPINESVPLYSTRSVLSDSTKVWKDEILLDSLYHYFCYTYNESEKKDVLPRALVFQGSYYNRNADFLKTNFRECIGVHNYHNILNLDYYLNIFQPDLVIFDLAEYVMNNNYFGYDKLKELDLNPAIHTTTDFVELPFPLKNKMSVLTGCHVDNASIRLKFVNISYAYLKVGDKFFDMTVDDNYVLKCSMPHGVLDSNSVSKIFIVGDDGYSFWLSIESEIFDKLNFPMESTSGTSISDSIVFATNEPLNSFSSVVLQLYDTNYNCIKNINAFDYPQYVNFQHSFDFESGVYILRLRANSNKLDEYVDMKLNLLEGARYLVSFNIDKISSNKIVVSKFELRKKE